MLGMESSRELIGGVLGLDPRILEDPNDFALLTLGARNDQVLSFFTPRNRLLTIAANEVGSAPDRILMEWVPPVSRPLPMQCWKVEGGFLVVPGKKKFDLTAVRRFPSTGLSMVRDFPGHMRGAVARLTRNAWPDLERRLHDLAGALKLHQTEEVELPILRVVGFGPGTLPVGDMALCGMLLTGRALGLGSRATVHWLGRLSMEVRRFLHRTTKFSAAFLNFALEGRTTRCQEMFFGAMAGDFEGAADIAASGIMKERDGGGEGFLAGVLMALDMVRQDFFPAPENANPGF